MPSEAPLQPTAEADVVTASDDYASRFASRAGQWMLAVQTATVRAMLPAPPCAILDVGGGHAQLAGPLAAAGYRLTVTGSAPACAKRLHACGGTEAVAFRLASCLALPFDARAFDHVLSVRLLTHCADWPAVIGELCRVARIDVIIDYPTSQSVNALAPALFSAKRKVERNTRNWRSFRHAEIRDAFAVHGFTPVRQVGQFVLPMVLHRMLNSPGLSWLLERICAGVGLGRWGSPVIVQMRRATDT
jgi:ubiquinone/menaquinone biosynthesis C-methylase UbiE